MENFKLLDVVALTVDRPDLQLQRGQVGTIVEELRDQHFEVEFSDDGGVTYAQVPLPAGQLLRLQFAPAIQAA